MLLLAVSSFVGGTDHGIGSVITSAIKSAVQRAAGGEGADGYRSSRRSGAPGGDAQPVPIRVYEAALSAGEPFFIDRNPEVVAGSST